MSYKSHIKRQNIIRKTRCALQKAAGKILNLRQKYTYNKLNIIPTYIYNSNIIHYLFST